MKAWSNDDMQKNTGHVPERRLLAVLQRAVTDYLTGDGEVKNEAYEWLMFDDNDNEEGRPLTFKFICEALDFNIKSLRLAIQYHSENQGSTDLLKEAI